MPMSLFAAKRASSTWGWVALVTGTEYGVRLRNAFRTDSLGVAAERVVEVVGLPFGSLGLRLKGKGARSAPFGLLACILG